MKHFFCYLPLISSSFFGYELANFFLRKHVDFYSKIAIGSCFGINFLGLIFLVSSYYFNISMHFIVILSAILMLISIILKFTLKPMKRQNYFSLFKSHFIFFIIIPSVLSFTLHYFGSFNNDTYVFGSQFTELPIDMEIINSIVYGCNMKRKSLLQFNDPLFSGRNIILPNVPDIISAYFMKVFDLSLHSSIVLPSIPFFFSSFYLLNALIYAFSGNDISSTMFGVISFMLFGGRGYIQLFDKVSLNHKTDFIMDWGNKNYQYCLHPILHMLIPQRTTLFSFPLCLGIFLIFIKFDNGKNQKTHVFIFTALLVSILPLIQIQAFIAVIEWILPYMLFSFIKEKNGKVDKIFTKWAFFLSMIIILPYIQLKGILSELIQEMHIVDLSKEFGYSSNFLMLYNGFHFFFIYSFIHGIVSINSKQIILYLPSIFVFIISLAILYQSYAYDNIKTLLHGWIPFASATIGIFLSKIWAKTTKRAILFFMLIVLPLWTSGIIFICGSITATTTLYNNTTEVVQLSQWIKENTSPDSIWLVESRTVSPSITIAGRQSVLGSLNYAEARKIQYESSRKSSLLMLIENMNNTELSDSYDVQFICIESSPNKQNVLDVSQTKKWDVAYESSSYVVYRRI